MMSIHRPYFFDSVRESLFSGSIDESQVAGLNVFLDWYDKEGRREMDDRAFAYVLATAYHETAATIEPIAEYGKGEGHEYGEPDPETGQTYYGRGYVQLTWRENYAAQDKKLDLMGLLVSYADAAMQPTIALQVIVYGMRDGDFTGAGLSEFFTDELTDFYNARTIVNGHDRADDIAGYAVKFLNAITHTRGKES
jgi:putative chitinase